MEDLGDRRVHLHCHLHSLHEIPLPLLTPALLLIQLRVAEAPHPSRLGKAAARSPGQRDILAFGHDRSAFVLAVVTAAVGYRMIQESDTESSKEGAVDGVA